MLCRSRLIGVAILGMLLTAVTALAQVPAVTIKVDLVSKVNVGGSFGIDASWKNCTNIDSVVIKAMDANSMVIGTGSVTTNITTGQAVNIKVATTAKAGDTVTFQAFAQDANMKNIATEAPPLKTAVAK